MNTRQLVLMCGICITAGLLFGQVEASSLDRLIGYAPGQLSAYQAQPQSRAGVSQANAYDPGPLAAAWSLYRKAIQSAQSKGALSSVKQSGIKIGRTAALSAGPGSPQHTTMVRNYPSASQNQNIRVRMGSQGHRSPTQFPELAQFQQYRRASASNRSYQQTYQRMPVQQYGYAGSYYQQYGSWGTNYYPGAYSYYGANCYGST